MRYMRFWLKGDREEIFDVLIKWAKASKLVYIRSELDPRSTLVTPKKKVSKRMLDFLFGGFPKEPSGYPFLDIHLFDHGNNLIEAVFRVVEDYEDKALIVRKMLEDLFPFEDKKKSQKS